MWAGWGNAKKKISARSQQTQTLYLQEQAVAYKLMFAFLRIHNQKWNLRCGVKCSSSAKQALRMCEALGSTFGTKKEKRLDAKSKTMVFIFSRY